MENHGLRLTKTSVVVRYVSIEAGHFVLYIRNKKYNWGVPKSIFQMFSAVFVELLRVGIEIRAKVIEIASILPCYK